MRMNPRAVLAPDVRDGVRGAVVDEQDVYGEPACLRRKSTEDSPERPLLIARHHDRKAAMKTPLKRKRPA